MALAPGRRVGSSSRPRDPGPELCAASGGVGCIDVVGSIRGPAPDTIGNDAGSRPCGGGGGTDEGKRARHVERGRHWWRRGGALARLGSRHRHNARTDGRELALQLTDARALRRVWLGLQKHVQQRLERVELFDARGHAAGGGLGHE